MIPPRSPIARGAAFLAAGALVACSAVPFTPAAPRDPSAERAAIARVLDDLHDAAAHADENRYFGHFALDAVFLGTDASERWNLDAFRAYAHPRFAAGKAWAFRATRRTIVLDPNADVAWFDEDLATQRLGPARGSGVLVRRGGGWLIEQYNLALVVPNARFDEVHAVLERGPKKPYDEREGAARAEAVSAALRGDLAAAEKALRAVAEEAEHAEPGSVLLGAIALRNDLAWILWAKGDLPRALEELELARADETRSQVGGNLSVLIWLGLLHDQIILLRDVADAKGSDVDATEALAEANLLRTRYARRAGGQGETDGVAVIDALWALRKKDPRAALAAAKRIHLDDPEVAARFTNDDTHLTPIDLYFLAQAYELAKDKAGADRLRELIQSSHAEPIERAIVLHLLGQPPQRPRP
jgi:tetratricopeptide (TPR) repeat protein